MTILHDTLKHFSSQKKVRLIHLHENDHQIKTLPHINEIYMIILTNQQKQEMTSLRQREEVVVSRRKRIDYFCFSIHQSLDTITSSNQLLRNLQYSNIKAKVNMTPTPLPVPF